LTGVTYSWVVVSGICTPSTATTEDFTTTIQSEGTVTVALAITKDGTVCEKVLTITAVRPEVTELSWKNDHALLAGSIGSTPIADPVWVKPLGSGVTKNDPGAYSMNGSATAELKITGAQALTHATSVQVKGDGNTENFFAAGAIFRSWTWSAGELQLSSSTLHSSVNFYDTLNVTWYYRVAKSGGGYGSWVEMNQSQHLLYTTLGIPTSPEASPHVDILDWACHWSANQASADAVCSAMLSSGFAAHYTWGADCHRLSSDFLRLVGSLGVSGSQHNWSSRGYLDSGSVGWMCWQRTKAFTPVGNAYGVVEWRWHQWAEASGSQRDPSAATSLSGTWGGYEDNLFTHYYRCTSSSPFAATWTANQAGQSAGCEVYPTNCSYQAGPQYSWRGPDR